MMICRKWTGCLILLSVVVISGAYAQRPLVAANGAALVEAENRVTAKRGTAAWQKASPVLALAVGDSVQTGDRSRAVVRVVDSTGVRIDQLTTLTIQRSARESGRPAINLINGALFLSLIHI